MSKGKPPSRELQWKLTDISLTESDRQKLKSAASTVSTATMIGTLAGLSLGAYFAFKVRSNRRKMFQAFRATEKPTHVRFASGREEAIPDISPLVKPSTFGDFLTYTLFASGGVLLGGETGLLIGGATAKRSITSDPETKQRIENAFRSFRADVLRKQIEQLEGGKNQLELSL
ncbi:hypothetical protein PMZ80_007636 [Knufia obscura]|uniref:Transmembrane protein 242 n=1 Tax=Knufia obscura TaxID=1635080 RepID=A0ABR0RHV9_9EURO|nr:hypothetical protein PMZ80_007636 [Knufia obscura]